MVGMHFTWCTKIQMNFLDRLKKQKYPLESGKKMEIDGSKMPSIGYPKVVKKKGISRGGCPKDFECQVSQQYFHTLKLRQSKNYLKYNTGNDAKNCSQEKYENRFRNN